MVLNNQGQISLNFTRDKEKELSFSKKIILLGCFMFGMSASTYAFDYEEHKHISQRALILAQKNQVVNIENELIREQLNSKYLCEDLLDNFPGGCLTLSDFPAIAGDHAASPLLTKWKWLNEGGIDSRVVPLLDYIAIGKVLTESECTSSETTRSRIPKVVEFSKLVHRYPINSDFFAQDDELAQYDQNYIRSAGHNCHHFRNPKVLRRKR